MPEPTLNAPDGGQTTAPGPEGLRPPPPRRSRIGRALWWALSGLLVLTVLVVAATATWFWTTEAGTRQLLSMVPGVQVSGAKGRVTGGAFSAETLTWESNGTRVVVDGLHWNDLALRWRPHAGAWVGVTVQQPQARTVRVTTSPKAPGAADQPLQLPADLQLPLAADVNGLQLGSVVIDQQAPITGLRADLHLGAAGGTLHRIDGLSLSRGPLRVAGAASIGSGTELPLDLGLEIVSGAGVTASAQAAAPPTATAAAASASAAGVLDDWQSRITAKGPLRHFDLAATLSAVGQASATVKARVTPLRPFPLAALDARLLDIDLSALVPGLPQTRLSGTAVLADITAGQPLDVTLALANAEAGPWDAKRLPVRTLHVALQGRPDQLDRLNFKALLLELGGEQPGGRITGEGAWQGRDLQLTIQLADLQPQRLDGRVPAMRLDGPITLALHGLPVPGTSASESSGGSAASAAGASAASAAASGARPAAPSAAQTRRVEVADGINGDFKVGLTGRLAEARGQRALPTVAIEADGRFASATDGALRLLLQKAAIRAGEATATATADVRMAPSGQLQVQSKGELLRFDPGAWVAQVAGGGPGSVSGGWEADLQIPPAPKSKAGQAAAAPLFPGLPVGLTGDLRLRLDPSRVSGLPLEGEATLKAGATAVAVLAALQAGGNAVKVDGHASVASDPGRAGSGSEQRWTFDVDAQRLAELAPLKSLLPGSGPNRPTWFPQSGKVRIHGAANGHWPTLTTAGTLQVEDYRSPLLALGKADGRWTFSGLAPDAPLNLQATVIDLEQGQQRVERLQLALDGTPRSHTLAIDATSPVRPPEWVELSVAAARTTPAAQVPASAAAAATATPAPALGSEFQVQGRGGWQPAREGAGGTWSGTVSRLSAAPRGAPGRPWLAARDLQLSVQLDGDYAPVRAALQPNRIAAFGGALTWQQASWQPPAAEGALPRIALDARLEPLQVSPWLVYLQPQFGWSGDLALGGTVKIRSDRTLDADVVIERAGDGDLALTIDNARRVLGLKQLRVELAAHDGVWELKQALDGTNIGVVSGRQTVRARPDVLVPDMQAALQGSLGLVVPQLQVWAPWLPPGWRLGGKLQAGAVLSGTVGDPDYRGQVLGSELAVKNLFEGVNLRDGDLAISLAGTNATIERFVFKGGGDGTLSVTGKASLGEAPKADLRVIAQQFRALDRIDRRVALSGSADASFAQNNLTLKGKFTIDEGLIDITQSGAPTLDDDVVVYNLPGGPASTQAPKPEPKPRARAKPEPGSPAAATAKPAAKPLQTDVRLAVDLGRDLRLRGRGLNTLLRGELVITTPGNELAVNGVIRAEEGTYTAYGQNLVVDRGRIYFTGEVANPRLDILAVRPDIDIRVGVIVSGPAANPRVRLYSEPNLNEFDTLTWLVLGRAPEGLGRDDTALLQRAALALLAGDQESGGGVINKLGLDELSVSNGTQGAVVSLGKQISKRVYVGYEKALSATGGTWQLIYRVVGRITVRARAGTDNAVDAIWTWRWD